MRIAGNLNEVKDRMPLPGGRYRVRVSEVPREVTKAKSGRNMLEFRFQLCEPPGPEYWDTLTYRVVEQDNVGWANRAMRDLFQCFNAPYDSTGFDTDTLLGREGWIVVEQQVYDGKLSNNVAELCKPA